MLVMFSARWPNAEPEPVEVSNINIVLEQLERFGLAWLLIVARVRFSLALARLPAPSWLLFGSARPLISVY